MRIPAMAILVALSCASGAAALAAPGPVTELAWTAGGDRAGAEFGQSLAAGDFNGDGRRDVLVGAPSRGPNCGVDCEGYAYLTEDLISGPGASVTRFTLKAAPDAEFGAEVACGDVNGDGRDDVIIGAPGFAGEAGAVFVWHGVKDGTLLDPTTAGADWTAAPGFAEARFGATLHCDDINGDGIDDLLIGAPGQGSGGRVYAWYGGPNGLGSVVNPDWIASATVALSGFGTAITTADVNGDMRNDVIVGAPLAESGNSGRVHVYLGGPSGPESTPTWTREDQGRFGRSLAGAGDIDGDGRDDVLIGAPRYTGNSPGAGAAFVYGGATEGLTPGPIWFHIGDQAGALLGARVAAGDVTGDGRTDVLIASPLASFPVEGASGRVDLFPGIPGGVATSPSWSDKGPGDAAGFGAALLLADLTQSGFDDVVVAAPDADAGGQAYVFDGEGLDLPPRLARLSSDVDEIVSGQSVTLTIELDKNAPLDGATVELESSDEAVLSVPSTTAVEEGSRSIELIIFVKPVITATRVSITATIGGESAIATVLAVPPPPEVLPERIIVTATTPFVLDVVSFSAIEWDAGLGEFYGAAGVARLPLDCDGSGVTIELTFSDLRLRPIGGSEGRSVGLVDGFLEYSSGGVPLEIDIAGFRLLVHTLTIADGGAEMFADLEPPVQFAASNSDVVERATLYLGIHVPFYSDCSIFMDSPTMHFGPWIVTATDMEILGTGVVVDLSTWQAPALPPPESGDPPWTDPQWRGLILLEGRTEGRHVLSNTGYLQGRYEFANALVTSGGFTGDLDVVEISSYETVQPYGYEIEYEDGFLRLFGGNVVTGELRNGVIRLPETAVVDASSRRVAATFDVLEIQSDLDLAGVAEASAVVHWGELLSHDLRAFSLDSGPLEKAFYTSGVVLPEYYPLDGAGEFDRLYLGNDAESLAELVQEHGIQGLSMIGKVVVEGSVDVNADFNVHSPDTPDGMPPGLPPPITAGVLRFPWITIGTAGVTGEIAGRAPITTEPLGPTYRRDYDGGTDENSDPVPFYPELDPAAAMHFRFVDSAVYSSSLEGSVDVPDPIDADIPFENMNVTSTAQIAGADVVLDTSATIDYWDLELVQRNASPAGVLYPKSGKIYLTGAGLHEITHFAVPFWLTWGTIQANGQLGKLIFDHNNEGQAFDGFPFEPTSLFLSDYLSDGTWQDRYLQAAGHIFFPVFGAYHLDIRDHVSPAWLDNPGGIPAEMRRVIILGDDGLNGVLPSETDITGQWGGSFADMSFEIDFDSTDFNGFRGPGITSFYFVEGDLTSYIDLNSERPCLRIEDDTSDGEEILKFDTHSPFSSLGRTTGCACLDVDKGVFERIHLQSEVEDSDVDGLAVRSAEYFSLEMDVTPATSDLEMRGNMFFNLGSSFDIELLGAARFQFDRDDDYADGSLDGRVQTSALLAGSLDADGQLSWHVDHGSDYSQSLQGRLGVRIVAPGGSLSRELEGGFFVGRNTPRESAWILLGADSKFVDLELPERISGVYGYAKYSRSVNIYIISGGREIYAGMGFLGPANGDLGPVGQMQIYLWGKFLGGVLSGAVRSQLAFTSAPPSFAGSAGLRVCAVVVACLPIELSFLVDSNGVHISR